MKKITYILLIFIVGFFCLDANCQTDTKKPESGEISDSVAIKTFWTWFKKNEKSLKEFQKNPDTVLTQILDAVMEINPGLAIELEPPVKGIICFTISANGDHDLLPIVKEIIQHAPKLKGWDFIAYRQQISTELLKTRIIKIGKKKFDPNQMKFKSVIDGNKLDLIIYAKGISNSNYNDVSFQLSILIDQILGEFNCSTQIGHIDYLNMPKDKKELSELKPLLELADYVTSIYKIRK